MTQFVVSTTSEDSIYAALELSKNSWLLAIQVPGRDNPSLYPIKGGHAEGLMAKLDAARDRVAKVTGRMPAVTLCYEAGYDGFWLARFLEQRGIMCLVMEPASLRVNRRARARAGMVGTEMLSRNRSGAAPVPPPRPSRANGRGLAAAGTPRVTGPEIAPGRLPSPARSPLLGVEQTSFSGDWMSACSQEAT